VGQPLAQTIISPTLRDAHHGRMARYLRTGKKHVLGKTVSLVALHKAGHEFPVSVTISPFNGGSEQRFVAFLRDVTAEKQTEAALEQHRQELQLRAEKLEQYAWLVSHDLKEPLRKVTVFADILKQRFGGGLPADGHSLLTRITDAMARMDALIDAVLAYANVSHTMEEKHRCGWTIWRPKQRTIWSYWPPTRPQKFWWRPKACRRCRAYTRSWCRCCKICWPKLSNTASWMSGRACA